jgi:23S rRNA pseudouridine1911/1915/1917 synthase
VDAAIARDPADRRKNHFDPDGKRAVTHIKLLEKYRDYTYAECRLETGRTHQIRVHTQYIGHPILGDEVYAPGRKSPFRLEGQCLHAMTLGFIHPRSGGYIETAAPVPEYMERLLKVMPK